MDNVEMKACPFCGKPVDLDDQDTLYPSGTGWLFNEELQMNTYHRMTDVPQSQWCWSMNCPTPAGGCGAEISGDSRQEAIDNWNRRSPIIPPAGSEEAEKAIEKGLGERNYPSNPKNAARGMGSCTGICSR